MLLGSGSNHDNSCWVNWDADEDALAEEEEEEEEEEQEEEKLKTVAIRKQSPR